MTQNGKKTSLSMSQETAKQPNSTLAPSSFSEYLKTLAASRKTSLASCNARITIPIRKKLHMPKQIKLIHKPKQIKNYSNLLICRQHLENLAFANLFPQVLAKLRWVREIHPKSQELWQGSWQISSAIVSCGYITWCATGHH